MGPLQVPKQPAARVSQEVRRAAPGMGQSQLHTTTALSLGITGGHTVRINWETPNR